MRKSTMVMMLTGILGTATAATGAEVSRAPFGSLPDGETVEAITLTNKRGMKVTEEGDFARAEALYPTGD